MSAQRAVQILFLLLIAGVFLHGIDNYPLTERSEARYSGVAWEMVRSGDYVTPQYNGIKHFHKPPLFYWSVAACMKLLGESELAARLPTTLAAFGVLALTFWLTRRMKGEEKSAIEWLAVGMLASSPFFWEMGRVAVTDMLVSLFVILSLASAWVILEEGPSRAAFLVFWVSMGLDFLTKGPVGPLIVSFVVIPYAWRQRRSLKLLIPLPGVVLAALIGLPWYLLVAYKNPGLVSYFLIFQTVDRVVTNVHHRDGPIWFYLPVVLGGFLPWTAFLPEAFRSSWRAAKAAPREAANPDLMLLLWAIVPLAFFSLITSKLPPYVLPTFPALAVLAARAFSRLSRISMSGPPVILLLASALCLAHGRLFEMARLTRFAPDLQRAGCWLLAMGLLSVLLAARRQAIPLVVAGLGAVLGLELLAGVAAHKLDYMTAKPLSDVIRSHTQGPPDVAVFRRYLFGLPYYLGGRITHVEHEREVQFQSDDSYKNFYFLRLADYLQVFRKGDRDRFLIVFKPDLPAAQPFLSAESVIFSDGASTIFMHAASATSAP